MFRPQITREQPVKRGSPRGKTLLAPGSPGVLEKHPRTPGAPA